MRLATCTRFSVVLYVLAPINGSQTLQFPAASRWFVVPKGELSAEYKLRHNGFPDISVEVHPELFFIVGLAPAHDGADLAAHEAETFGRRPASGHASELLPLL